VGKFEFGENMKGWKTTLGAIITIIGTAYGMYHGATDIGTGIGIIGGALSAIGIGHKLDKAMVG
jgi:hypothetical protein